MIEIDGVRRAFEFMRPYEYGDELSDSYFRLVDLVTRTSLDELKQQELLDQRRVFDIEESNLRLALERYGEYDGESVTDAYNRALAQIDRIIPTVVETEMVV